jgi:hypothetical protein
MVDKKFKTQESKRKSFGDMEITHQLGRKNLETVSGDFSHNPETGSR